MDKFDKKIYLDLKYNNENLFASKNDKALNFKPTVTKGHLSKTKAFHSFLK